MSEDRPPERETGEPDPERPWTVDARRSRARLLKAEEQPGGKLVYVDGHGRTQSLPPEGQALTPEQARGAEAALSSELGAPDPGYAKVAALERLAEMRAAGTVSQENYDRERRRLLDLS